MATEIGGIGDEAPRRRLLGFVSKEFFGPMAILAQVSRRAGFLATLLALGLAGACSSSETVYPDARNRVKSGGGTNYSDTSQTVFGEGGVNFADAFSDDQAGPGGAGIGVNSFLWRASLDTVSFMPLASADPFGGVIITDWYAPPETLTERFKVTVYILGRDLRADGIRAAVFKQQQDDLGNWIDAAISRQTSTDLEDTILTRARQLRIAQ